MPTTNRVALLRFALQMAELKKMIGGRMRELRLERQKLDPKWTQDFVARQIEPMLTGTQVSRWERGETKPGDDRLEKIAEVFTTTVSDLYAGPMADRKPEKKGDLSQLDGADPMAAIRALSEAVEKLRVDLAATRHELLSEIETVRQAPASQRRSSKPAVRKSATNDR